MIKLGFRLTIRLKMELLMNIQTGDKVRLLGKVSKLFVGDEGIVVNIFDLNGYKYIRVDTTQGHAISTPVDNVEKI